MRVLTSLFRRMQQATLATEFTVNQPNDDELRDMEREVSQVLTTAHQLMTLAPAIGHRYGPHDTIRHTHVVVSPMSPPQKVFSPTPTINRPMFKLAVLLPFLRREPHANVQYDDYLVEGLRSALVNEVKHLDNQWVHALRSQAQVRRVLSDTETPLSIIETHNVVASLTGHKSIVLCGFSNRPKVDNLKGRNHFPWSVVEGVNQATLVEHYGPDEILSPTEVIGLSSDTLGYAEPYFQLRSIIVGRDNLVLELYTSMPRYVTFEGTCHSQ